MKTFIGHLHPLLVHLPIGIWIIYILLEVLRKKEKFKQLEEVNTIIFLFGTTAAILSIITGLIQSDNEGYDLNEIFNHQWMAIGTTISFIIYFVFQLIKSLQRLIQYASLLMLFILLSITGHLGGILTHGSSYLNILQEETKEIQPLTIKNINQAVVYKDLVQYVLDKNCVTCHGPNKQKGNLRLDNYGHIMEGGKTGKIIQLSQLEKSELIRRIVLDDSDDKHMPPKGKLQLHDFEIQLLNSWVIHGASSTAVVSSYDSDSIMIQSIKALQKEFSGNQLKKEISRPAIDDIEPNSLKTLQSIGWSLIPLKKGDHYYRAVAFNVDDSIKHALNVLKTVSDHIIELKLSFSKLNDQDLSELSGFTDLEKLWLDHTSITSNGLKFITSLKHLQYLNIFSTPIEEADISTFVDAQHVILIAPKMKDTAWKVVDTQKLTVLNQ